MKALESAGHVHGSFNGTADASGWRRRWTAAPLLLHPRRRTQAMTKPLREILLVEDNAQDLELTCVRLRKGTRPILFTLSAMERRRWNSFFAKDAYPRAD